MVGDEETEEFYRRKNILCSDCFIDFLTNTCHVIECETRIERGQQHCSAHAYQCNY